VRRLIALLCTLPAATVLTVHTAPGPDAFVTVRQGVADPGSLGRQASLSLNGRFVAFVSGAPLVAANPRGYPNIYVLDRESGQVTLESAAPDGCLPGHACASPRLSADGRFLTFETNDDGESGVDPPRSFVLVRDRRAGQTRRVGPPGDAPNGSLRDPSISSDGRLVVFAASASNLVPGADANGMREDVYSFDVASNQIRRLSVDSSGVQPATGASFAPSVTGDGRYVAFSSTAPLDGPSSPAAARPLVSVFVRDTVLHTTRRISVRPDGRAANGASYAPAISDDGRYVAFVSDATDLVKGDTNRAADIYLYDADARAISLVSRNHAGRSANGASTLPAISADGAVVVFQSDASDLTCGPRCVMAERDINLVADVFALDRVSGTIRRLSTGRSPWMEPSVAPAIDGAGRTVAFSSRHPCYAQDEGDDFDLFVGGMNIGTAAASNGRSP
jgi:Tol biopolymer transport system component